MKLILPNISNQTYKHVEEFSLTLQRISIIFNPTLTPKGLRKTFLTVPQAHLA